MMGHYHPTLRHTMTRFIRFSICCLAILLSTGVSAQRTPPQVVATNQDNAAETLRFSVEAQREVTNDLIIAQLFFELTDTSPATLSQKINQTITKALETAKTYPDIKIQTSGSTTAPVYTKSGGKIEAWRMRSDIRLETENIKVLSELIGKLQTTLMLSDISMTLSPQIRTQAIEGVTVDAIRAFEQRAKLLASTRGKRYRIRNMDINDSGFAVNRVMTMMADKSSSKYFSSGSGIPLESGNSTVTVNIHGSIELID